MSTDIVVAGAGHNSLVTAAYLTRAGYRCRVLDARPIPGGGASTEELFGPGYRVDTCATGHTLIQANPLLARDELGLLAERGLSYLEPDPVAHVVFPDGESFTMWLDLDRTCEQIGRFSREDVDAYRRMLSEYKAVADIFMRERFTPLGFGPGLEEMLAERPGGLKWLRRAAMTAHDVIMREYTSRHVQSFMLWMALQTAQPVDSPGSGMLAYSLVGGRQVRSWTLPRGGSGELVRALVEVIEEGGGEVLCGRRVVSLVLEKGRCVGVETDDGERHLAAQAVLSTIHVRDLVHMAPPEAWGEDFLYGVDTFAPGLSAFGAHYLTTEPPRYTRGDGGEQTAVSAGVVGWPEDLVQLGRDGRDGRVMRNGAWLLFVNQTVADPSRAPEGHHLIKILGTQPYDPGGGPESWADLREEIAQVHLDHLRRAAPNLTDDVILDRHIMAPPDIERANPHMWHGTFHGGDRSLAYAGWLRPAPGWAQHRMPIPGLYQTGGTTHPGGSVTGAPGRNAAIVMLTDLGRDPGEVMAPRQALREGAA